MPALVHAIPTGDDVTVPFPPTDTLSTGGLTAKVAVTVRDSLMVTTHAPVPLHAPDHPANVLDSPLGVTANVTCDP